LIERRLRKHGALAADEHVVDVLFGRFLRFFEAGKESTESPRLGLLGGKSQFGAALTPQRLIFIGKGFARACPLVAVYRAELHDEQLTILFSTKPTRLQSMIEMRQGSGASAFVKALLEARALQAEQLISEHPEDPNLAHLSEFWDRVAAYPRAQILDLVVEPPDSTSDRAYNN
jgi:hypothetical protein